MKNDTHTLPTKLRWDQANEITWKLSAGETLQTDTVHGVMAGSRTTRAVAWVMAILPGLWYARWQDKAVGPSSLFAAKRAAEDLWIGRFKGKAETVADPVSWLNRRTAHFADRSPP